MQVNLINQSFHVFFRLAGFMGSIPVGQCHDCTVQRNGRLWPINTSAASTCKGMVFVERTRTCTVWFFRMSMATHTSSCRAGRLWRFPSCPRAERQPLSICYRTSEDLFPVTEGTTSSLLRSPYGTISCLPRDLKGTISCPKRNL